MIDRSCLLFINNIVGNDHRWLVAGARAPTGETTFPLKTGAKRPRERDSSSALNV